MRGLVLAFALTAATPVWADDYAAAKNVVDGLVQELLVEVKANKALYQDNDAELFALIRERILPVVDVAALSRLVLNKHWKGLSEEQRGTFTATMESLLVRSYGKSLTLLTEVERIHFPPPTRTSSGKYVVVRSDVTFQVNEPPLRINYVMHDKGGQWRVFDLVIDGLSLVKQFRQNFDREIREDGFDALVGRLEAAS